MAHGVENSICCAVYDRMNFASVRTAAGCREVTSGFEPMEGCCGGLSTGRFRTSSHLAVPTHHCWERDASASHRRPPKTFLLRPREMSPLKTLLSCLFFLSSKNEASSLGEKAHVLPLPSGWWRHLWQTSSTGCLRSCRSRRWAR